MEGQDRFIDLAPEGTAPAPCVRAAEACEQKRWGMEKAKISEAEAWMMFWPKIR
jgi:hypothetical protein